MFLISVNIHVTGRLGWKPPPPKKQKKSIIKIKGPIYLLPVLHYLTRTKNTRDIINHNDALDVHPSLLYVHTVFPISFVVGIE